MFDSIFFAALNVLMKILRAYRAEDPSTFFSICTKILKSLPHNEVSEAR